MNTQNISSIEWLLFALRLEMKTLKNYEQLTIQSNVFGSKFLLSNDVFNLNFYLQRNYGIVEFDENRHGKF